MPDARLPRGWLIWGAAGFATSVGGWLGVTASTARSADRRASAARPRGTCPRGRAAVPEAGSAAARL